jgi:glycosyltransferase involved in cell wall biosynthesis
MVNLVDPHSSAAVLAAALSEAPTVVVLHLPGTLGSGPETARLRDLYRRARWAISPSEAGRGQLVEELGVPEARAVVIHNGVDLPDLPAREELDGGAPLLGSLGRLTNQKGFDVLIEAVRGLVHAGTSLRVTIGGSGREAARLAATANGLPISFRGFVSDTPAFLSELDLFCLASRAETFPLALLEAMARELPCIATDVGDIKESLGSAVLVVPAEDPRELQEAIGALAKDPGLRASLGRSARRLVSQDFRVELTARRTCQLLDSALSSPGPRPVRR